LPSKALPNPNPLDERRKEETAERKRRRKHNQISLPFIVVLEVLAQYCYVLFFSSVSFCLSVCPPSTDAGNPPIQSRVEYRKKEI
jgi:hypothetical protein